MLRLRTEFIIERHAKQKYIQNLYPIIVKFYFSFRVVEWNAKEWLFTKLLLFLHFRGFALRCRIWDVFAIIIYYTCQLFKRQFSLLTSRVYIAHLSLDSKQSVVIKIADVRNAFNIADDILLFNSKTFLCSTFAQSGER